MPECPKGQVSPLQCSPKSTGHDPVAMHTSHTFFRYDKEKPDSHMFTTGTKYGYDGYHLEDPGRNKCNRFPLGNFGSQEQTLSEAAASPNSLVLSSIQRRADSNNSDKDQSIPATAGNLNVQIGLCAAILTAQQHSGHTEQIQGATHQIHGASESGDDYKNFQLKYPEMSQYKGSSLVDFGSQVQNKHEACPRWPPFLSSIRKNGLHTANCTAPRNIGQVAESKETVYGIREAPTVQFTTHLATATGPWPLNGQVHKNEFSVRQKTQGEFIVPQPVISLQGQPVLPEVHALPDYYAHSGQRFDLDGQILKNLVAGSQSTEISKQIQDTSVQSMQMQSRWNLQPAGLNVQAQHQTSQIFSVLPHKSSADMVGAGIDHNAVTSEDAHINPNLSAYNTKAPLTAAPVRKQSSKRNQDPRLATSSSAPPSVPVPPNQYGVMVQQNTSILSGRKVHKFEIAIDSNGNPEILSHSVTLSAGNTIVSHSEVNKGESKCDKQTNEHKMFKSVLINFTKEGLTETWCGGRLTKELYKVIVRKVVEKIMSSEKNIPKTKQRIGSYLKLHKRKMDRLIQEYLVKHTNGKLCS